jgi:hypothetical protein
MPGYEVQIRENDKRALKDSAAGFDTGSLVGALKPTKLRSLTANGTDLRSPPKGSLRDRVQREEDS